ncbi:hypothetical protein BC833DRAFT_610915 [Globomyces pollinis-pini]|nr:hypothetical protein BC833DRAFT_610915 [Globomyces pollinis-pini]
MFSLNIKFLNPKWKFWIMITLIVFHFAFCFNSYTFFRYLPQVVETGFVFGVELDDLIRRLPPYWITFVMIWDSVPVLLVALVLCATQIQQRLFNWRVMKTVLQVDRVFNIVIATQLLIIILYSVLGYIQMNTDLLGSDRTYFFYGHFRSTIYGIHGLCSGLLIDRLKSFIPKVIETKDSVITSKLTTQ